MRIYRDRSNTNSNIVHNYKLTVQNQQINTNGHLSNCDLKDVISFDSRDPIYLRKLYSLIKASFDGNLTNHIGHTITQKLERKCNVKKWLDEGENCEILKADSLGWQTGKFKLKINLSLEFIPDEPKDRRSPLDDVRQEMNTDNI